MEQREDVLRPRDDVLREFCRNVLLHTGGYIGDISERSTGCFDGTTHVLEALSRLRADVRTNGSWSRDAGSRAAPVRKATQVGKRFIK